MNKTASFILIILLPLFIGFGTTAIAQSQAVNSAAFGHNYQFSVQGTAGIFNGTSPTYSGQISPKANLLPIAAYKLENIQVGDIFFSSNGGMYEITAIPTPGATPTVAITIINDPLGLGIGIPPSGDLVIGRPTGLCGYISAYVSDGGGNGGTSFPLETMIENYNKVRQDSCQQRNIDLANQRLADSSAAIRNDFPIDTDTQLSEAEVDAYVANNGFVNLQILADSANVIRNDFPVDTDTQLSEAEVDAYVANNGFINLQILADSATAIRNDIVPERYVFSNNVTTSTVENVVELFDQNNALLTSIIIPDIRDLDSTYANSNLEADADRLHDWKNFDFEMNNVTDHTLRTQKAETRFISNYDIYSNGTHVVELFNAGAINSGKYTFNQYTASGDRAILYLGNSIQNYGQLYTDNGDIIKNGVQVSIDPIFKVDQFGVTFGIENSIVGQDIYITNEHRITSATDGFLLGVDNYGAVKADHAIIRPFSYTEIAQNFPDTNFVRDSIELGTIVGQITTHVDTDGDSYETFIVVGSGSGNSTVHTGDPNAIFYAGTNGEPTHTVNTLSWDEATGKMKIGAAALNTSVVNIGGPTTGANRKAQINLNGTLDDPSQTIGQSGIGFTFSRNGDPRWAFASNNNFGGETGGSTGSDFKITSIDDQVDGGTARERMRINRNNGHIGINLDLGSGVIYTHDSIQHFLHVFARNGETNPVRFEGITEFTTARTNLNIWVDNGNGMLQSIPYSTLPSGGTPDGNGFKDSGGTAAGSINMNAVNSISNAFTLGLSDENSDGNFWSFVESSNGITTGDFIFKNGSASPYTLNDSGSPTNATDLITKSYFDANNTGGGSWDHNATQNIDLGTFWLSPDGSDKGLSFNANNNLVLGTTTGSLEFLIEEKAAGQNLLLMSEVNASDNARTQLEIRPGQNSGSTETRSFLNVTNSYDNTEGLARFGTRGNYAIAAASTKTATSTNGLTNFAIEIDGSNFETTGKFQIGYGGLFGSTPLPDTTLTSYRDGSLFLHKYVGTTFDVGSTTGKKIAVFDDITGKLEKIDPALVGGGSGADNFGIFLNSNGNKIFDINDGTGMMFTSDFEVNAPLNAFVAGTISLSDHIKTHYYAANSAMNDLIVAGEKYSGVVVGNETNGKFLKTVTIRAILGSGNINYNIVRISSSGTTTVLGSGTAVNGIQDETTLGSIPPNNSGDAFYIQVTSVTGSQTQEGLLATYEFS